MVEKANVKLMIKCTMPHGRRSRRSGERRITETPVSVDEKISTIVLRIPVGREGVYKYNVSEYKYLQENSKFVENLAEHSDVKLVPDLSLTLPLEGKAVFDGILKYGQNKTPGALTEEVANKVGSMLDFLGLPIEALNAVTADPRYLNFKAKAENNKEIMSRVLLFDDDAFGYNTALQAEVESPPAWPRCNDNRDTLFVSGRELKERYLPQMLPRNAGEVSARIYANLKDDESAAFLRTVLAHEYKHTRGRIVLAGGFVSNAFAPRESDVGDVDLFIVDCVSDEDFAQLVNFIVVEFLKRFPRQPIVQTSACLSLLRPFLIRQVGRPGRV